MLAKNKAPQYKAYLKKSSLLSVSQSKREQGNTMAIVSHYVLSPTINGFVLWVLREAIRTGKKRLYFMARDGYFMYHTAKELCALMHLPLECRYLKCSRYAIRIPLFSRYPKEAMEYICRHSIDVNMTKILKRAGLSKEECGEVLADLKVNYDAEEIIPYAELKQVKKMLAQSEVFLKYMKEKSDEALPNLLGYLRQEGLLEDVGMAIVDSGWTGTMQKNLDLLIQLAGGKQKLEGYYWGLYEIPAGSERDRWHCYYFSPEGNIKEKVNFSNCLFEAIITAPHGMALGYQEENNQYLVIQDEISEERKDFVRETGKYIKHYTHRLMKKLASMQLEEIDVDGDRKVIAELLKLFMAKPIKEEVELYGGILFSDDVLESCMQPVAGELSDKELAENHLFNKIFTLLGGKNTTIKESAWFEGSAVRNGKNVKWHLLQYAAYKHLLYLKKNFRRRDNG